MARDLELLEKAEQGTPQWRVYSWTEPWVTLGRFQKPEQAILPDCQISRIIRPTGGKAVLHGHDVTLGMAVPLASLGLTDKESRSVGAVYRHVIGPIVEAMQAAGSAAELAEKTDYVSLEPRTADCFAHVSPNDVVDPETGQKVCGCALRLTATAVLLQASMPISEPLVDPSEVFARPSDAGWTPMDPVKFTEALSGAFTESLAAF
jgi:lipoate-protein ligase A